MDDTRKNITPFQLRWTYPSKWFGVFFKCEVGGPPLLEQWRQHICWLAPGSWSLWQQACKPLRYGWYHGHGSYLITKRRELRRRKDVSRSSKHCSKNLRITNLRLLSQNEGESEFAVSTKITDDLWSLASCAGKLNELLYNSAGTFSTFQWAMDTPGHQGGHDWWHLC